MLLPVLRTDSADKDVKIAEAIKAGNIKSIEVTMTVPNALQVIEDLTVKFGDEMLIGAGTVLDAESFLKAGAVALGVGGKLVNPKAQNETETFETIQAIAQKICKHHRKPLAKIINSIQPRQTGKDIFCLDIVRYLLST